MTAAELNRSNDRFRLARATFVITIERRGEEVTRRLAFGSLAARSALRRAAKDAGGVRLSLAPYATCSVRGAIPLAGVGNDRLENLPHTRIHIETPCTPPGGYDVCARLA